MQAENLMIQCKRYRKVNVQRPRKPHYARALFEAVTTPIYEKTRIIDDCRLKQESKLLGPKKEREVHPYLAILAKELREFFETSNMTLICHRNSINSFDYFNFRVALHKNDIQCKVYGKAIVNEAIKTTKYRAILPLFESSNCIIFASEPKIAETLKILRKNPRIILLGGILEDRIMSKNELVNYSKLPDLQIVRAQFAATLQTAGGQILNNLQAHQSNLCYLLDAHAKALASPEVATESSANSENQSTNETTKTE